MMATRTRKTVAMAAGQDQERHEARSGGAATSGSCGEHMSVSLRAERGVRHCRDMLTPALACHDDDSQCRR